MNDLTHLPLKTLRYGHDPEAGEVINARVTRRDQVPEGTKALIAAYGVIVPMIAVRRGANTFVIDGNLRLKAMHDLKMPDDTKVPVRIIDAPDGDALKMSLAVAVSQTAIHPVDEYEGFAAVVSSLTNRGITDPAAKLAADFGRPRIEIDRALAVGALSPKIREAWRKGVIDADCAKAFTLFGSGDDAHGHQDKLFGKLAKESRLYAHMVKAEARSADRNALGLLKFVGIEAFEAKGGTVTRDLFDEKHVIHNPAMMVEMAHVKISDLCREYETKHGWAWAMSESDAPAGYRSRWHRKTPEHKQLPVEKKRLAELSNIINRGVEAGDETAYTDDEYRAAEREFAQTNDAIKNRSYSEKLRATCGVILSVDEDGQVGVSRGWIQETEKPAASKKAAASSGTPASTAATKDKPKAEPSSALLARIDAWKAKATIITITEDVHKTPLSSAMARIIVKMIDPEHTALLPGPLRDGMKLLREAVPAKVANAALRKAFDAPDYFASVPRELAEKALHQMKIAHRPEGKEARVQVCVEHARKTKWLPPEMRVAGYDGPDRKKGR